LSSSDTVWVFISLLWLDILHNSSLETNAPEGKSNMFSVASCESRAWVREGAELLAKYLDVDEGSFLCLS